MQHESHIRHGKNIPKARLAWGGDVYSQSVGPGHVTIQLENVAYPCEVWFTNVPDTSGIKRTASYYEFDAGDSVELDFQVTEGSRTMVTS